jgi:anti-sigma28 factor (negative regulator of flagellin synthesis)
MKIDNPLSSQVSTGAASQAGGITASQSGLNGRSRVDGQSDQVQLSNLSSALRGLANDDPGRAAQVERIASVVRSGEYRIDAAQLGRSILADSMEIRP